MSQVTVTIAGKTYRMACDDGQEEHLYGLASRLDAIINEIRGVFGEIGDQRLQFAELVGRHRHRTRNDQRRTRFVDQDAVDLVDDGGGLLAGRGSGSGQVE